MNSQAFPLDFDALKKGDVIPQEQIEKIFQVRFVTDQDGFRRKALKLSEMIEAKRPDIVARVTKNSVHVLTDAEADPLLHQRNRKSVRDIARNTKRRTRIDHAQLSTEQRRAAETHDNFATALTIATRKVSRKGEVARILAQSVGTRRLPSKKVEP